MLRLAVAIADHRAAPSAFVVWRGFADSMRKAADAGYHGVELALRTADEIDADALRALLDAHGLQVSCISTGQVYAALGLAFTHPDAAVRSKVVDVFRGLIELAGTFGGMINVGRVRGQIAEGHSPADAEHLFVETTRRICDDAAAHGVTIVLEPVNRYEINFINTLADGAALCARVARPNLGLMPDVFHMNIEDARIGASLQRHAALIKYIHLADSNRRAPGQGHLDFDDVFAALEAMRYRGWAAVEILPQPDPDTAARQAAAYLLPRVVKYNAAIAANTRADA